MNRTQDQATPFRVIPIAFVVAYENTRGELIAVSEHGNATSAEREAAQRNIQRKAMQQETKATFSACETRPRRAARYFEPDVFA